MSRRRFVIKRYPHGWVVLDKLSDHAIEWYGHDRTSAHIAACWHNADPMTRGQHPYPHRFK